MSERKIHVTMAPDDSPTLPFYDRHFAPLLALAGVVVAAFFAMNDNILNLFINQPPEVEINLTHGRVAQGDKLVAWSILSDEDGSEKETLYHWELIETNSDLLMGTGEDFSRLELPTEIADTFTVLLTITDKEGRGKSYKTYIKYTVTEAPDKDKGKVGKSSQEKNNDIDVISDVISTERIILSKDEIINWDERQAQEIVTNGHKLIINASDIASDLKIVSFQSQAASGRDGNAGKAGNNGAFMQAGSNGLQGSNGSGGKHGSSASEVLINITGTLNSKLEIENSGQIGGVGGTGGRGGPGGSGGQGKPSKSGILDCSSGPGRGAQGGSGGNGGSGGDGGIGGNGGMVRISIGNIGPNGNINAVAIGGTGGSPGPGGEGGIAGAGGPEGRTSGFCSPAGRQGRPGSAGNPGRLGFHGGNGIDATISLTSGNEEIKGLGSLKFP